MNLTVLPLTPERLPDLEELFNTTGPVSRCWCMYWRIGAAYRHRSRDENKAAFSALVQQGPPPGLLAYADELAVGWCQLTPREALPWLEKARWLRRVDELPVWCISCFYIRKGYRKRGVTTALIRFAIQAARQAGAHALEAYPLDAELTPSTSHTGYLSTYLRLGFKEVARQVPPRPIVRYELRKGEQPSPSPPL